MPILLNHHHHHQSLLLSKPRSSASASLAGDIRAAGFVGVSDLIAAPLINTTNPIHPRGYPLLMSVSPISTHSHPIHTHPISTHPFFPILSVPSYPTSSFPSCLPYTYRPFPPFLPLTETPHTETTYRSSVYGKGAHQALPESAGGCQRDEKTYGREREVGGVGRGGCGCRMFWGCCQSFPMCQEFSGRKRGGTWAYSGLRKGWWVPGEGGDAFSALVVETGVEAR